MVMTNSRQSHAWAAKEGDDLREKPGDGVSRQAPTSGALHRRPTKARGLSFFDLRGHPPGGRIFPSPKNGDGGGLTVSSGLFWKFAAATGAGSQTSATLWT